MRIRRKLSSSDHGGAGCPKSKIYWQQKEMRYGLSDPLIQFIKPLR